jgi:aminoglycoside phosphotransferase (APT) family kinase protein
MNENIQPLLQTYCARSYPARQGVRVSKPARISEGWETEIYSFDLEYDGNGERKREGMILRIYPGRDAVEKSRHEFKGMRELHQAGYPVPQVHLQEDENTPFGNPFIIMQRIEGRMLWEPLFNSPKGKQQELLTLFCGLFVRLHSLDWVLFTDDPSQYDVGSPYLFVDHWLNLGREHLIRFSLTGFLPLMEWLETRRDEVPCTHPSLNHNDFHPGNVLLCEDGTAAVVDWPHMGISDARFDLAWTLVLITGYEGKVWRDRILSEYERLAGGRVEGIEYFEVFASVRRLFDLLVSLSEGAETLGMRPGAQENMMQRLDAYKAIYHLLLERTGIRVEEVERLLVSAP